MRNKYLNFISDQHLLNCIENLYNSYERAKENVSKKKLYKNKIDSFKLFFDSKFNNISEKKAVENEILRQIDKSINNSIGTFHEEILGGVKNFEKGNSSGYDIKASDNTLFADLKNKHNTMNSSASESLFQKLSSFADRYKTSKCYWVQILAKNSFCENWQGEINGKEYSHSRVYKISGDKFYHLITGNDNALIELYKSLPKAISDFLTSRKKVQLTENSALYEIELQTSISKRNLLDEITFENYSYYLGFDKL